MQTETFLYISTWFLQERMEFPALETFGMNRKDMMTSVPGIW